MEGLQDTGVAPAETGSVAAQLPQPQPSAMVPREMAPVPALEGTGAPGGAQHSLEPGSIGAASPSTPGMGSAGFALKLLPLGLGKQPCA